MPLGGLSSWFLVLGSWFLVLGSWFVAIAGGCLDALERKVGEDPAEPLTAKTGIAAARKDFRPPGVVGLLRSDFDGSGN